jgi:hypothetical protein
MARTIRRSIRSVVDVSLIVFGYPEKESVNSPTEVCRGSGQQ